MSKATVSRAAIFFLVVMTLGLALLLSLLGFATLKSNLVGWFLLITGLIYFFGVIIVYWIRGIRFWGPRAKGKIVKEEQTDWSFWMIVAGMAAAFYLPPVEFLYFKAILPQSLWMPIAGWILILCGSVLFIWARGALGEYYSGHVSVLVGQPLIQSGPYRFIRHPAYAGYVLIAAGITVGYTSLTGVIVILFLLLPAVVYRLSLEDRFLAERFGDQFRAYAHATARLIPGVW
jgi:protein-S-isoprenylcysteine O-methyltransferase Ste14